MIEPMLSVLFHPYLLAIAGLGAFVVGTVYFVRAYRTAALPIRVATSAYAPAFAILFLAAVWLTGERMPGPKYAAYAVAQLVPLLLLGISLAFYPGPKRLHLLLAPIALFCAIWLFAWGEVLTYGK